MSLFAPESDLGAGLLPDTGGPTSPDDGSPSDIVREMIRLGGLYQELVTDDTAISEMASVVAKLQSRLAREQQQRDRAFQGQTSSEFYRQLADRHRLLTGRG